MVSLPPTASRRLADYGLSNRFRVRSRTRFSHSIQNVHHKYNATQVRFRISRLEIFCALATDTAIRATNMQGNKALAVLRDIVSHTDRKTLQSVPELESLVKCSLVLIQAYVAHLQIRRSWCSCLQPIPFETAEQSFNELISKLIPERMYIVQQTLLVFLRDEQLWKVEFICREILLALLACKADPAKLLDMILNYLIEVLENHNTKEVRHVMRVLYDILDDEDWSRLRFDDIKRMLQLYSMSIVCTDPSSAYYNIDGCFKICFMQMFKVLRSDVMGDMIEKMLGIAFEWDVSEELMLDFGYTIENAARAQRTKSEFFHSCVRPPLFNYILKSIASSNRQQSLVAARVLAKLIDSHHNFTKLNSPKLFLTDTSYDLVLGAADNQLDIRYLELYRIPVQNSLLTAIERHSSNRVNLESVYTIMGLFICQFPCSYIAGMISCLAFKIQNYTLAAKTDLRHSNTLHALIISIMTLVCWTHKARTLSDYINQILDVRFDIAPHLNPPLKTHYQYARHHVVWYLEQLYLDPVELRYGLWKRFRCHEKVLLHTSQIDLLQTYQDSDQMIINQEEEGRLKAIAAKVGNDRRRLSLGINIDFRKSQKE